MLSTAFCPLIQNFIVDTNSSTDFLITQKSIYLVNDVACTKVLQEDKLYQPY